MIKNNLKQILKDRGIKQVWLADKSEITPTTLGNIIHHRFTPSLELAFKIVKVLNLKFEDIFYYEE